MPELRTREHSLSKQLEALNTQLADREVYLTLADNVEGFLTGLRDKAATATITERQRVLQLLIKDVLIGPDKITIRQIHTGPAPADQPDHKQSRNRLGGRTTT
jgi:site-specific DNA recombinase